MPASSFFGLFRSRRGVGGPISTGMRVRNPGPAEHGFTLVEVMVAISVLLIGVLGTVTMIDSANGVTSKTKAREGGTALARSILEIARGVPYKELDDARVLEELSARAGMADVAPATGHQISSRGFIYTVTPTVCSMDDPKDGLGEHNEVGVAFCSNSSALASGAPSADRNADDYRRIVVQLTWTGGPSSPGTTRQVGVVTNPVGGLGPSITGLLPLSPNTPNIVLADASPDVITPSYEVKTAAPAESVAWFVGGARMGDAEDQGTGTVWEFEWDLGPKDTPTFVDCTYVLSAEGYDDKQRAGARKALTVTLNRRRPFAPPNFAGGRNLNNAGGFHRVDLQWNANQECDVKGYRVYRGTDPGAINTLVCDLGLGAKSECVDETAPPAEPGVTLYYEVAALDEDPNGVLRVGDRSSPLAIDETNAGAPSAPTDFTICTGGMPDCNDIDGVAAPSGSPVLSWQPAADVDPGSIAFYRVYRDGLTYADRLDVLFPVPGKPLVFIDSTATESHSYAVTAVDEQFGESALTDELTWP
jgi:prepilin-type N-terminal cleavage/methylation domain-containing protein